MTAAGDAVLVWSENDGTRFNIWAKRYVSGDGWRNSARIETDPGNAFAAQVALDADGNAVAVWEQGEAAQRGIRANRYIAGEGWGAAVHWPEAGTLRSSAS